MMLLILQFENIRSWIGSPRAGAYGSMGSPTDKIAPTGLCATIRRFPPRCLPAPAGMPPYPAGSRKDSQRLSYEPGGPVWLTGVT
jgi:hypothetical protein